MVKMTRKLKGVYRVRYVEMYGTITNQKGEDASAFSAALAPAEAEQQKRNTNPRDNKPPRIVDGQYVSCSVEGYTKTSPTNNSSLISHLSSLTSLISRSLS